MVHQAKNSTRTSNSAPSTLANGFWKRRNTKHFCQRQMLGFYGSKPPPNMANPAMVRALSLRNWSVNLLTSILGCLFVIFSLTGSCIWSIIIRKNTCCLTGLLNSEISILSGYDNWESAGLRMTSVALRPFLPQVSGSFSPMWQHT